MAFRKIHACDSSKGWRRPRAKWGADSGPRHARKRAATAPWRVERWYPFLDQDLVVFLTTIPLEQLLRPGERRCLMRRARRSVTQASTATYNESWPRAMFLHRFGESLGCCGGDLRSPFGI